MGVAGVGVAGVPAKLRDGALPHDLLSAVHVDHVPGDPVAIRGTEAQDGIGHVLRSGEAAGGVPGGGSFYEKVVSGDLPERWRVCNSTPDCVHRDLKGGQLVGELAAVGFEGT